MADLKKRDARPRAQAPASVLSKKKPDGRAPLGEGNASPVTGSEDWRELARRIQQETDSGVMLELVQQLIDKLDEDKLRRPSGRKR